ncbi:class II aldolase/adducin family protein [Marinomonas sp. 5E14-1]|uniref:class II aldolase/adducin family protein n=1 Tax=Marinomonas sp. 5E14-1 TaxID=3153922 RepID=UPI003266DBE6
MHDEYAQKEAILRRDLAAAYRLAAMLGWEDTIYTHFSVRLPDIDDTPRFLINPFGLMFDEVKASDLIIIDVNGNILEGDSDYNLAGFTIHSAVHTAREDAHCVMHTHTVPGMALAACDDGLLMLNQINTEFYNNLGYHDYEGVAWNLEERQRIQKSLGNNIGLVLRHHGLLTVGETVADAFQIMYYLNKACEIQLATAQMASLTPVSPIPEKLAKHVNSQFKGVDHERHFVWQAWLRKLDRIDPSYKD